VALDVVHQRFHTGDDQVAFAGASDLASPAQSLFQVALGAHINPSLSWHRKLRSPQQISYAYSFYEIPYGNGGAKLRDKPKKIENSLLTPVWHIWDNLCSKEPQPQQTVPK
jgi:hypothetical protein